MDIITIGPDMSKEQKEQWDDFVQKCRQAAEANKKECHGYGWRLERFEEIAEDLRLELIHEKQKWVDSQDAIGKIMGLLTREKESLPLGLYLKAYDIASESGHWFYPKRKQNDNI